MGVGGRRAAPAFGRRVNDAGAAQALPAAIRASGRGGVTAPARHTRTEPGEIPRLTVMGEHEDLCFLQRLRAARGLAASGGTAPARHALPTPRTAQALRCPARPAAKALSWRAWTKAGEPPPRRRLWVAVMARSGFAPGADLSHASDRRPRFP